VTTWVLWVTISSLGFGPTPMDAFESKHECLLRAESTRAAAIETERTQIMPRDPTYYAVQKGLDGVIVKCLPNGTRP